MAMATEKFNSSIEIGQGGYGKVYKGILADGTVIAIKHAQEGSLQGEKEFLTEIELLSRIVLGLAKGILYLYRKANPPTFHRDIKASNILLDSKYTAKVANFGLSRLAPILDIDGTEPAHISTLVKGTPGYLDPEYFLTHKLTNKSDVYNLGVVFLELLTGMRPYTW
ncbi:hypothetical protein FH972_013217 [Carpinus fangiana]|uniref:Protein kinase domain-containing protein n=1 Tax=Carpinus fangiana TaxID=176857 RepID=A0A5N6R641_9ROSI|nr:hypothetical protein FH972_013217 [Carpinus fangiana]